LIDSLVGSTNSNIERCEGDRNRPNVTQSLLSPVEIRQDFGFRDSNQLHFGARQSTGRTRSRRLLLHFNGSPLGHGCPTTPPPRSRSVHALMRAATAAALGSRWR